jgi:hypothetical protein
MQAFRNRIILKQQADMGSPLRDMKLSQNRRMASSDLDSNPVPWRGGDRQLLHRERQRARKERSWNEGSTDMPLEEQLRKLPGFLFLNQTPAVSEDAPSQSTICPREPEEEDFGERFAACFVNTSFESVIRAGKFRHVAVDGSFCCDNKY